MNESTTYFFSTVSIIPVRSEPKDQAEIVTQLLFGEVGEILESKEPWVKIRSAHDNYEGWIDIKQIIAIKEKTFKQLLKRKGRQTSLIQNITGSLGPIITVKGSFVEEGNYSLEIEDSMFHVASQNIKRKKSIGDVALEYINAPYLWGGRTPFGIDCSGFTQAVLREFDIELLRDASQQVEQGIEIPFNETTIGDLAFFENKKGKITHVGIVLEKNKIIHASGRVKVESLNNEGIYSKELKKQTHKLNCVKRFLK